MIVYYFVNNSFVFRGWKIASCERYAGMSFRFNKLLQSRIFWPWGGIAGSCSAQICVGPALFLEWNQDRKHFSPCIPTLSLILHQAGLRGVQTEARGFFGEGGAHKRLEATTLFPGPGLSLNGLAVLMAFLLYTDSARCASCFAMASISTATLHGTGCGRIMAAI